METTISNEERQRILTLAKLRNGKGTGWMYEYQKIAEMIGHGLRQDDISAICRDTGFLRLRRVSHTDTEESLRKQLNVIANKIAALKAKPNAVWDENKIIINNARNFPLRDICESVRALVMNTPR